MRRLPLAAPAAPFVSRTALPNEWRLTLRRGSDRVVLTLKVVAVLVHEELLVRVGQTCFQYDEVEENFILETDSIGWWDGFFEFGHRFEHEDLDSFLNRVGREYPDLVVEEG